MKVPLAIVFWRVFEQDVFNELWCKDHGLCDGHYLTNFKRLGTCILVFPESVISTATAVDLKALGCLPVSFLTLSQD